VRSLTLGTDASVMREPMLRSSSFISEIETAAVDLLTAKFGCWWFFLLRHRKGMSDYFG
jgi:hypothetical protein